MTRPSDPRRTPVTAFGALLRQLRTARSLTQDELARRAGMTAKAVGLLERGERRRPYPHSVRALADALALDDAQRDELIGTVRDRATPAPVPRDPALPDWALPDRVVPGPAVPVFGRDEEEAAVAAALEVPYRRIVTLTGPGGVGKTTLALAVADRVRARFPGGVVVVELAGVTGPEGVLPAIATALDLPEPDAEETAESLASVVAGRRMLLVLDNLEHVLSCAPRLAALVRSCPELVVLATSRARLRLRIEQEVRVAPLTPPAAARLFADRAYAAGLVLDDETTAAPVAALVERADGLPLAVELAASAAALFGPAALLARLDALPAPAPRELPDRQRSMSATLAWSHDLLSAPARAVLACLSVCAGTFSLAVAEEVGGDDPDVVLPALGELLEHSMVARAPEVEGVARFRLLEPIRRDAATRLAPADRARARFGLARAMLEQGRRLVGDLRGAGQVSALRHLEADLGNLRVAFSAMLDEARHEDAAELVWLVWQFLVIRGHARDGREWTSRLASRPVDDVGRARLLIARSALQHGADRRRACDLARDALVVARRIGAGGLAAEAATLAMTHAYFASDLGVCAELLDVAEAENAAAGVSWWSSYRPAVRGRLAEEADDTDAADRFHREAEAVARRSGNALELTTVLAIRGIRASRLGFATEAATLLREAVELAVDSGNTWSMTYVLSPLVDVAVRLGEHVIAARLTGAASSYAVERAAAEVAEAHRVRDATALVRASLGAADFERAWRLGCAAAPADVAGWAGEMHRRAAA
ncbi:helix-turn-helix domain-containing protein [Streptomyces sp. WMMC500]|uniref:ATP-binding protein n=1 Tax=Streptomyces sp. WMMC500 TaxID=3015154 RepID=UPI00248D36D3|nr:helix-turn-helix domain-containing protein [Streptomyces sp. WMMC500]WBB58493.1 helix-turn-helix domain-containing protein [Streptomyces sp. WMMC500]